MESFPLFFRIRAITFTIIMTFSFLWFVLLSVEIFARWAVSDQISHSLMISFLLTNTFSLIMLPILILVQFRVWLDAARLFLLFCFQIGSAAAGTYWGPKIHCPDQTPDDVGVCQLISVYTEIACWIVPVILVLYSTYFVIMVYLQSRIPVVVEPENRSGDDPEMGSTGTPSSWRDMLKEIVVAEGSSSNGSIQPPRPSVSPTTARAGPSSLTPFSVTPPQSAFSNVPRRQSTMPHLSDNSQQYTSVLQSVPSRHHSLPAFRQDSEPRVRAVLALPIPHSNASASLPQTPSSLTHSTSSPSNPLIQSFDFEPGNTDVGPPTDHRWRSKHLSMMYSRGMQSIESPTTRSKRARLSKPLPAHLL